MYSDDPGSGSDLAELVVRWVRWVAAHRQPNNPIEDRTGRHAGRHQPDDVWFLAGTLGGAVTRQCVAPAGRPLFFPAFCWWEAGRTAEPAEPWAKATGFAQLDGAQLPLHSVGSPASFPVRGFFNNVVTAWPWPMQVSCWGLWCLVPPPSPGAHQLSFGGTDDQQLWVEAQYQLDVRQVSG
ncbi:hypothetical protein [Micromonospora qiuiae]|nr:hypothetical protein [Micromonospora qiuiae]